MKTLIAIVLSLLLALPAWGSDLTRSITFANGSRLTAAQLHELLDGATIASSFLTGKDTATNLLGADYLLLYTAVPPAGFRKIRATAALYNNTALITDATAKSAPTAADYLLLYDATGLQLAKTSIGSLQSNITYTLSFTNLDFHSTPTNNDKLLVFSAQYGSNRVASLASLITNLPALGWGTNSATNYIQLTNADQIPIFSTVVTTNGVSNVLSKVTFLQLSNAIAGVPSASFTSTNVNLAAGSVLNMAHGLGATPSVVRWVLVCTTANAGYSIGDEIPISSVVGSSAWETDALPTFTGGANATNVFLSYYKTTPTSMELNVVTKNADGMTGLTEASWKAKVYAKP